MSDASGRRLNYSLGTIGAAQILEEPPRSYDEYKETDVPLDPFYHDVPKLKHSKRRKRSLEAPSRPKKNLSNRSKRDTEHFLKHSDIIKSDEDAVNVLKFLFDWYRNEKTNPARLTTPVSTPLVPDDIFTINDELSSSKPEESEIEISTGTSAEEPLNIRFKTNDLFNKKSKYSILGDDKYSVTHEELKKTNKIQQNLSFSDTKESPKYSFLDDYVDDNYEPETYKSKYNFDDHLDDHDRFKYSSFLDEENLSSEKDFWSDKDKERNKSKFHRKEQTENHSIPKDYVDDNIEPLYYKDRYSEIDEKQKVLEQRSSSEEKYVNKSKEDEKKDEPNTHSQLEHHKKEERINERGKVQKINDELNNSTNAEEQVTTTEEIEQTTIEESSKIDEPKTQVEQTKILSQAHLESVEIEDILETTSKRENTRNETTEPVQSIIIPSTEEVNKKHSLKHSSITSEAILSETSPTNYLQEPTKTSTTEIVQFSTSNDKVISTTEFVPHYKNKDDQVSTPEVQSTNVVQQHTTDYNKQSASIEEYQHVDEEKSSTTATAKHERDNLDDIGEKQQEIREAEKLLTITTDHTLTASENPSVESQELQSNKTDKEDGSTGNLEKKPINQQKLPVQYSTETIKVNQSEPEVNVVVSKATKTNRSRSRTKGRGRRKFNEPEISFKNVLVEKLLEKPFRAKDDYDYLKTVSNVQSSTTKIKDSTETNDSVITSTQHHIESELQAIANDLLLPTTSTVGTIENTRKRARQRHKVETTSTRNIRKRRPSLNQIHTSTNSATSEHNTLHSLQDTPDKVNTLSSHHNDSKEPFSEINIPTSTSQTTLERKVDEIEHPFIQYQSIELSTTLPVVDTTQTTPIVTLIEEENLGTTNHPLTESTINTEPIITTSSSILPDLFTLTDKIEDIYTTSFVPTEKVHTMKEKELKVNQIEEIFTTTNAEAETTEPTTIWKPLIVDLMDKESDAISWTTANMPTQEEPAHTTLTSDYHSPVQESTTDVLTTNLVTKTTTEEPRMETTIISDGIDETQAPKSLHVTEHLQKLIGEIETTTKSVAAPLEHVSTEHHYEQNTHLSVGNRDHQNVKETTTAAQSIVETTYEDTGITTNEIKEEFHKANEKHRQETIESNQTGHHQISEHYPHDAANISDHNAESIKILETTTSDMIPTQNPTTEEMTTNAPDSDKATTTIQTSHFTEPTTTTEKARALRIKERPLRRRPYSGYQSPRSSYRHRFSTEEFTRRPENRKHTVEEEIISTIARRGKQLTTEPTVRVKKLKGPPTNVPLRKSVSPTLSEKLNESPLTTPLSRKTTVRKYYFFNCFNKETDKFYPDPRDCRLFHYCTQGYTKNQLLDMKFVCDFNTYFDDENLVCTKKKPKRCL